MFFPARGCSPTAAAQPAARRRCHDPHGRVSCSGRTEQGADAGDGSACPAQARPVARVSLQRWHLEGEFCRRTRAQSTGPCTSPRYLPAPTSCQRATRSDHNRCHRAASPHQSSHQTQRSLGATRGPALQAPQAATAPWSDPYQVTGEAVVHAKTLLVDQRARRELCQVEPKRLLGPPVGPVESPDLGGEAAGFLPTNTTHSDPPAQRWLCPAPAQPVSPVSPAAAGALHRLLPGAQGTPELGLQPRVDRRDRTGGTGPPRGELRRAAACAPLDTPALAELEVPSTARTAPRRPRGELMALQLPHEGENRGTRGNSRRCAREVSGT